MKLSKFVHLIITVVFVILISISVSFAQSVLIIETVDRATLADVPPPIVWTVDTATPSDLP